MKVQPGIEVLLQDRRSLVKGSRIGAVVHPPSVLEGFVHTVDALLGETSIELVALFGPQHGVRGEKQDNMIESGFFYDSHSGLPVHSLYGRHRAPTEAMLDGLDILVVDLQDVGTRVYTFAQTMAHCMESCAQHGKQIVVLDRPNPIGGKRVEGNLLEPKYRSFVGLYPLPMRHGLTMGELALLLNQEFEIGCRLTVVPLRGWRRSMWWDETALPWISPSPNLPTLDSATVYPGLVLVEGTELSEGRGTTRPFELVGAPFVDSHDLASQLAEYDLPGVFFRATSFQPAFQKHSGQLCGGVQIHVTDRESFHPYRTGVAVLASVRKLYPEKFRWKKPPYEYENDKLPIDVICGSATIRTGIEAEEDPMALSAAWTADLERFEQQRRPYLLYP